MADELPESELEKAAALGNTEEMKQLVCGDDFDGKSEDAASALCIAAGHGHWDAVHYLVQEAGVDVGTDDSGGTVLQLAAVAGRLDVMKMLVAAGASMKTARVSCRVLLSSAATGQLSILRYAIDEGADVTTHGGSAAWSAAKASFWDAVQVLITAGADLSLDGIGVQLLAFAEVQKPAEVEPCSGFQVARNTHDFLLEVVELLCKKGVKIDSEAGTLALLNFASTQDWHICADAVRYLVNNGVNLKSEAGSKALVTASVCGDLEILRCLVDGGVDVVSESASEAVARAGELGAPGSTDAIVAYLTSLGAIVPKPPDLVLDEDF